ncbi:MAG: DUF6712 family protein [Flavipsychrobacter sp.]
MSLVKSIDEAKKYISLSAGASEDYMPDFDQAEAKYLVPIIGWGLYNDLLAVTDNSDGHLRTLREKALAVSVCFGYVMSAAGRQVLITDAGMMVAQPQNQRSTFKWEYNYVVEQWAAMGYDAQEILIDYLSCHRNTFPKWSASPYNDPEGFQIIRNGAELAKAVSIRQPHRVHMMLRPIYNSHCEAFLRQNLGDAYYEALTDSILQNCLSDEEKALLPKIRAAAAHKAMQYAAIELNVLFGEGGFTIAGTHMVDTAIDGRTQAGDAQMQRFLELYRDSSKELIGDVVKQLNKLASATVFPEYYSSDLYKDPTTPTTQVDNSCRKGFFGV